MSPSPFLPPPSPTQSPSPWDLMTLPPRAVAPLQTDGGAVAQSPESLLNDSLRGVRKQRHQLGQRTCRCDGHLVLGCAPQRPRTTGERRVGVAAERLLSAWH